MKYMQACIITDIHQLSLRGALFYKIISFPPETFRKEDLVFFVHLLHLKTNDCDSGIPLKPTVAQMVYHFMSLSNHSKCLSYLTKRV